MNRKSNLRSLAGLWSMATSLKLKLAIPLQNELVGMKQLCLSLCALQ
jgi:hypothetical protein